jgi:hypothetical protein
LKPVQIPETTSDVKRCSTCGETGHDRRTCGKSRGPKPSDPWSDLEYEDHDECQKIVEANPDGLTLEEVGAYLGITRERVRQIEVEALTKLREATGGAVVETESFAFPLALCEGCGENYLRRGRSRSCLRCLNEPKKVVKVAKIVRVAATPKRLSQSGHVVRGRLRIRKGILHGQRDNQIGDRSAELAAR